MRRIYHMNPERKRIVQEALLQMRNAKEALGPEFMMRIKVLVKDFDPGYLLGAQKSGGDTDDIALSGLKYWNPADTASLPAGMEAMDRKKNLLIVMKYLQQNPDNKAMQKEIRTLLAAQDPL